ncbi:MAG TPA: sugar ABC transporter substrate-binding protein [Planctomycetaceae bacterium]|nr:sugar ABC transporter substrate-binding protein [Planctomycetaceae bacterium]
MKALANRSLFLALGLAAAIACPSGAQVVTPVSNHGYSMPVGQPGYVMPMHSQMTAGGAMQCDNCGYSATNPPAQPQVAAGHCQPCMVGVDCADNCYRSQTARDLHPYNFQPLAHGEFRGPVRVPSTMQNRIRVGDQLRFIYLRSQLKSPNFRLQIGDEIEVTSIQDADIKVGDLVQGRGVVINMDGNIELRMIGTVAAAGMTIPQLRRVLNERYKKFIKQPAIDVVLVKGNSLLESIINSVDARAGAGGQGIRDTVDADGNVRLPKIGAVCVLGLTTCEIKREINLRYQEIVSGLEVDVQIESEAPRFAWVGGAVATPGRITLNGPTTVTQAIIEAGGIIDQRGNNRRIAIFRRAEDWRLIATLVDLAGVHSARSLTSTDEIWVRDRDTIIVPLKPVARFNDFVDNVFTRGIYGVLPFAQVGEGFNANGFVN